MPHLRSVSLALCLVAAPAFAEPAYVGGAEPPPPPPPLAPRVFLEGFGNWGVNLGKTDYVPNGAPGHSKHPFATGFGAGGRIGVFITPTWLSVMLGYRYGQTSTREGHTTGVLDEAQGHLTYHQITLGVRFEHELGPGRLYADLAIGVVLPFHTSIDVTYAPELAAVGIAGKGSMKEDYGTGFGAHSEFGYHFDLSERMYVGAGILIAAFQSDNNGEDTRLSNFVTDFTARPPVPVTANIHHSDDGPVTPNTESIQDVRINVAIGFRL